tara:strand:- start:135 stop:542 length:408 start_codon:yes stop_codon:yes gene_type:complete
MARTHGQNADISFDSVALEDEANSVTMTMDVPEAEITAFADPWGNFLAGKPNATLSIDGAWDPAGGAGDITIFGELGQEAEEYDFEPDGSTGYNGFAIVSSYSITATVGDAISYSAAFRHNGGSAAADGAAPTRA